MIFTVIKDLKYVVEDNSAIDLLATCEEYGEIPMTLNIIDTEDLHVFFDGENEIPLEEYCKTQTIKPYNAPIIKIVVPKAITMRQARLHLLDIGLLDDVEALVSLDRRWGIEWEYASEVLRTSPLIDAIKKHLTLTDEQVDTMFIEASVL